MNDQRQIKFRAYDRVNKQMFYGVEHSYHSIGEEVYDNNDYYLGNYHGFGDVLDKKVKIWDGIIDKKTLNDATEEDGIKALKDLGLKEGDVRFDIMQFTGLYDSDGKEIYEGDILDIQIDAPVQVLWLSASFMVAGGWLSGDDLSVYSERSKIIGNIHESPELIKT